MKILIWDDFPIVNAGGPPGYLYNIKEYLRCNPTDKIIFLSDIKEEIRIPNFQESISQSTLTINNKNVKQKIYTSLNNSDNKIISFLLRLYHYIKKRIISIIIHNRANIVRINYFTKKQFHEPFPERFDINSLNKFDFIHFHVVVHYTRFIATYPNCKPKTILTVHSPCPFIDEQLYSEKKWMKIFRLSALLSESTAYRECDYMMFPCYEAMEPYNKVGVIRRALNSKKNNIFFVPTSILDYQSNVKGCELLKKNGIPDNHFIITYYGRHSHIKGYDILIKVGIDFLNKHKECTIVCAGKGEIEKPKHERWIELGFIDNVNDYLSISDIHVIPNRDTYFDIAMLEVLRAGKRVIVSRTGGNKYFLKYPEEERSSIHYFNTDNIDELYNILEKSFLKKQKNDVIYRDESYKNRTLFLKYFSLENYCQNYLRNIEFLTSYTSNKK